jgi:predicted Ser/Thr protein kinase
MMSPATPERPASRFRIGRYVVLGRIGRGGMGMVYRALDEELEREIALKVLTLEAGLDSETRRRFTVEAKAAAQLQHPNIVTIYELGEARGFPFIAMELLGGVDLESQMRSGEKLLLAEKLEIVAQVCRGLAYAHERRIVHRDVKPSNVRLLDDGSVKIMDFGIAKLGGTNLTQSGMVVGTVHYMSPEQVRGLALDGRSEVFSAGIVLQELVSGTRPFEGSTATEILYKIVHAPAPPLPLPPDTSAGRLQHILDRALAKDVAQRYPGADAMADELAEVQALLVRAQDRELEERTGEEIGLARRLLREGRAQDALTRLMALERTRPDCPEVRRAQRAALRQLNETLCAPAQIENEEFPELAATFQAVPMAPPTGPLPPPKRAAAARRRLLGVGAALLALALVAGGILIYVQSRGVMPAPVRVSVRSEPPGATVLVDGAASGTQTDGELVLDPTARQVTLTFRKEGYQDARHVLTLPMDGDRGVLLRLERTTTSLKIVSEPPGASVTVDGRMAEGRTPLSIALDHGQEHRLALALEGHAAHEQTIAAGFKAAELSVKLQPLGPTSLVSVTSNYPLDVSWNGRLLARTRVSPQVTLPEGRHTLILTAPTLFLRSPVNVETRGGAPVTLDAPGLGRINVQAIPDNCEVHIDGLFADYPPILDRAVAAGAHKVQFRWPDGARSEEVVEINEGRSSFVTGQRD